MDYVSLHIMIQGGGVVDLRIPLAKFGKRESWRNEIVFHYPKPHKKLRQSYDNPTTTQQACQDDLIKSQRQGSSVTLDALID